MKFICSLFLFLKMISGDAQLSKEQLAINFFINSICKEESICKNKIKFSRYTEGKLYGPIFYLPDCIDENDTIYRSKQENKSKIQLKSIQRYQKTSKHQKLSLKIFNAIVTKNGYIVILKFIQKKTSIINYYIKYDNSLKKFTWCKINILI